MRDGNRYAEQSADLQNLSGDRARSPSLTLAKRGSQRGRISATSSGAIASCAFSRMPCSSGWFLATDADRNGEIIEDTDDLDPVVEMLGGQIATGVIAADGSLALSGIDALHRGEKGRIDLELDLRVIAPNGVVEEIANRRGQSLAVEIREAMDTLQPFAPAARLALISTVVLRR